VSRTGSAVAVCSKVRNFNRTAHSTCAFRPPCRMPLFVLESLTAHVFLSVRFGWGQRGCLNVIHITPPPLRECRVDIPVLAEHFLRKLNARHSTSYRGVDRDAMRILIDHTWNGNVRELEHVLERAMLLGEGETITPDDLPQELAGAQNVARKLESLKESSLRFQRQHILDLLARTGDDKKEASRILGISLASLYRKFGDAQTGASPSQNCDSSRTNF
jgi:DNA-binding NtrC family response regulator